MLGDRFRVPQLHHEAVRALGDNVASGGAVKMIMSMPTPAGAALMSL